MNWLDFCIKAHEGQLRRNRELYACHPIRVASNFHPRSLKYTVALLHDVVEDTQYTFEDLVSLGLGEEELNALRILTRLDGESSKEHFDRVLNSNNHVAQEVKLYDLLDNSKFLPEDDEFNKSIGLDTKEERLKYLNRAQVLCDILDTAL